MGLTTMMAQVWGSQTPLKQNAFVESNPASPSGHETPGFVTVQLHTIRSKGRWLRRFSNAADEAASVNAKKN